MLSRFLRPTGNGLASAGAKLVRCFASEALAKTTAGGVGKLSEELIQREYKFGAHNYDPLPVVLCKAEGMTTSHNIYTAR